jgi:hypothetical protein
MTFNVPAVDAYLAAHFTHEESYCESKYWQS